jgi:hypothetical protein
MKVGGGDALLDGDIYPLHETGPDGLFGAQFVLVSVIVFRGRRIVGLGSLRAQGLFWPVWRRPFAPVALTADRVTGAVDFQLAVLAGLLDGIAVPMKAALGGREIARETLDRLVVFFPPVDGIAVLLEERLLEFLVLASLTAQEPFGAADIFSAVSVDRGGAGQARVMGGSG